MSWSKKAIVSYHFIEAAVDDYFNELKLSFDALLKSEESSGTFDAGESHFYWKINSKVDIAATDTYFISVVKEKSAWPVWFTEDDGIGEIPLNDGALGELYYAIVNPESRFILSASFLAVSITDSAFFSSALCLKCKTIKKITIPIINPRINIKMENNKLFI